MTLEFLLAFCATVVAFILLIKLLGLIFHKRPDPPERSDSSSGDGSGLSDRPAQDGGHDGGSSDGGGGGD